MLSPGRPSRRCPGRAWLHRIAPGTPEYRFGEDSATSGESTNPAPSRQRERKAGGTDAAEPTGPLCYDPGQMLTYLHEFSDNPPALFAFLGAWLVALITGIAFHEFSHAWTAHELGDDTAASQGRMSLNPIRHLDPLGTGLLLLVGFGWGKPTPVNPYRLRSGVKKGNAIVAAAGPVSNFFFAAVAALPLKLGWVDSVVNLDAISNADGAQLLGLFLIFIININVLLGVFNLIPIHPLDGFKIAVGVLPRELSRKLDSLSPWGPGILMTLIVLGWVTPYNPIGLVLGGVSNEVFKVVA